MLDMESNLIPIFHPTSQESPPFKDESENDEYVFYAGAPYLDSIPIEIFLKICSYLSPRFISHTLSAVCKRFENIIADESLWKRWVNKRLNNKKYPPISTDLEDFEWEKECINIDRLGALWTNENDTTRHVVLKNAHLASVDSIFLMREGSLCISGGRDRNLALWNVKDSILSDQSGGAPPAVLRNNAHDGWIWALTAPSTSSNTIFSGSWDSNIKVWDLSTNLKCLQSFRCPLAVLCLTCVDENVAVAGLFAPQIVIIDIRTPDSIVASHKFHEASILEITQDKPGSNMVYTTSEDRFICAFDMRAGALQQKKLLEPSPAHGYALSLAADTNACSRALFAGDTRGSLHTFDVEGLKKISSVPIFPTSKITGLTIGPSALLACSQAGDIAVMNPSCPVNRVSTLRSSTNNITELHYENDVLAIGTCDSAVELWVPLDSPIFS